jgi:hypothetical protein
VTVRLITFSLRQVLRLLLLACPSSRSKDLETQVIVWRMSRENDGWGYKRIPRRTPEDRHRDLDDEHPAYPGGQVPSWCEPGELAPLHAHSPVSSSIIACDLFTVESIRLKTLHVLLLY